MYLTKSNMGFGEMDESWVHSGRTGQRDTRISWVIDATWDDTETCTSHIQDRMILFAHRLKKKERQLG